MPDVSINTNIDVYCGRCGAGLCGQTSVSEKRGNISFTVDPCEKCLDAEYEKGREDEKDSVS